MTSPQYGHDCRKVPRDDGPCWDETARWRDCLDEHIKSKNVKAECASNQHGFDKCVASWRAVVGPDVRIRGAHMGLPPPQCQSISCLVQTCLIRTQYDQKHCERMVQLFKHCVKGLYGSEYVSD
jgi:hypothetical protein